MVYVCVDGACDGAVWSRVLEQDQVEANKPTGGDDIGGLTTSTSGNRSSCTSRPGRRPVERARAAGRRRTSRSGSAAGRPAAARLRHRATDTSHATPASYAAPTRRPSATRRRRSRVPAAARGSQLLPRTVSPAKASAASGSSDGGSSTSKPSSAHDFVGGSRAHRPCWWSCGPGSSRACTAAVLSPARRAGAGVEAWRATSSPRARRRARACPTCGGGTVGVEGLGAGDVQRPGEAAVEPTLGPAHHPAAVARGFDPAATPRISSRRTTSYVSGTGAGSAR